jgi:hypothetical protein
LDDDQEANDASRPSEASYQKWIGWSVSYIKCKFQERRTKREKENSQDRAARRTANATWFIALFTAVAVGVGYFQWKALHSTDDKVGKQLALMEADQRPWISIEAQIAGPISFSSFGAQLTSKITIKNVGKSPAFKVFVGFNPTLVESHLATYKAMLSYCREIERQQNKNTPDGFVLFPGEEASEIWTGGIAEDQIEKFKISLGRELFNPVLLVCIDYRSHLRPDEAKQTGRPFSFMMKDGTFGVPLGEGNIPADSLKIKPDPFRGFAK